MRLLGLWIILIAILGVFGVGKSLYQNDNTINIYNFTENNLISNESKFDSSLISFENKTDLNMSTVSLGHLKNIIFKTANTVGYIGFEIGKWGIEFGFENPDYNYLSALKFIYCILIFILFCAVMPIIPLVLALIYVFYMLIKKIAEKIKHFLRKR